MEFQISAKGPSGESAVLIVTTQLDPNSPANTVIKDVPMNSGDTLNVEAVAGQHVVITIYKP